MLTCKKKFQQSEPKRKSKNKKRWWRLINVSCRPGGTVLDCFMGSGSTGVACVNTERNFIGIDMTNIGARLLGNVLKKQKESGESTSDVISNSFSAFD